MTRQRSVGAQQPAQQARLHLGPFVLDDDKAHGIALAAVRHDAFAPHHTLFFCAEAQDRGALCFEVGIMDFNKYGGDIIFRITRPADGALIAMAKSGFVFFDYEAKKVVPMPQAFRDKFPQVNTLG
ncbi:thioesterase family protein [Paraburkholderia sp. CNPSo 3281]|uniref:thioesterase family protein n=1 Tax=Paraburkholderia sp. CNPSo 3281 TaxID=2940933 RepID=UPI0020B716BA|nr:thioesterase family protein [Paraburkholderia sp. CNPSo 3281]MCP3718158.1 thioesterase family protein [Paraburkholderia sp. CNPSo 3281]